DALEIAGVPARAEVNEILRTEEGGKGNVDLLASRYCASAFRERAGYSFAPHRAYLRALDTRSRFFLVRADSEQVTLTVTARLPYGEGEVRVCVNGEAVGSFAATREWTTHELA